MEGHAEPRAAVCFLPPEQKPDLGTLRELIPQYLLVAHLRPSGALGIWYDTATMLAHLSKHGRDNRWFIDEMLSLGFLCQGDGYWIGAARNADEARFVLGALSNGRTLNEHAQAILDSPGQVYVEEGSEVQS